MPGSVITGGNVSATPQQNTVILATGNYSVIPIAAPVAIPADHNNCLVTVARSGLPDTKSDVVHVRVDHSLDGLIWSPSPLGEKNWPHGPFPLEFTVPGGNVTDLRTQLLLAVSSAGCGFNAGTQHLRVTVTPLQPVITAVSIATANGPISANAITA